MNKVKGLIIIAFLFSIFACSPEETTMGLDNEADLSNEEISAALASIPSDSVSDSLATFLQYLREEEKLARDVYQKSYELYEERIFEGISRSEQRHMFAVKMLLDRYEIDDPVGENPEGVFVNKDLAELYNSMVDKSSDSLISALLAGAEIEEIDIIDIQNALAQYGQEDVQFVLNHLLYGSYHHLYGFVKKLDENGVTYQPKYLTQDQYETFLDLGSIKGHGHRGHGRKGRRHGRDGGQGPK